MAHAHLFSELMVGRMKLANRFVMPAMQRGFCRDGRPLAALAAYYRRRVEGGVALIIGESCAIDHPTATAQPSAASMTAATRDGWAHCVEEVHEAGGRMLIQLWHEGAARKADDGQTISPSGLLTAGRVNGRAATITELEGVLQAYVTAARDAQDVGADGVEVHAAHGFLLDQFLWSETNQRDDHFGGPTLADRASFPAAIVAAIRAACGPEFVISFRFSQWKEADYQARIAATPDELRAFVETIETAGADLFHASTRRFWEPEWEGDVRGFAGWVSAFTRRPVIAVGSVGLDLDIMTTFTSDAEARATVVQSVAELDLRMARGEFHLVAVGRALIGDPDFPHKVQSGQYDAVRPFCRADLGALEWDSAVVMDAHARI